MELRKIAIYKKTSGSYWNSHYTYQNAEFNIPQTEINRIIKTKKYEFISIFNNKVKILGFDKLEAMAVTFIIKKGAFVGTCEDRAYPIANTKYYIVYKTDLDNIVQMYAKLKELNAEDKKLFQIWHSPDNENQKLGYKLIVNRRKENGYNEIKSTIKELLNTEL